MKLFVTQSIFIQTIRIGGLSNSSVFQIGSAGRINTLSNLYNTGGFVKPAPEAEIPGTVTQTSEQEAATPLVPLSPPS